MRAIGALLVLAMVLSAPLSASSQAVKPAEFVYRLGWVTSPSHPQGLLVNAFKADVEKNSNGRIQVQLFPSGQLGGELEMVNAIRAGSLDMASVAATAAGSVFPALSFSLLPYFFPDREAARKVLDGQPGQMALSTLEQRGVKGLAWGEIGYTGLLGHRVPVTSAADVKGLKIRVVENPLFVATWRAIGGNPVPMAWPEVYTALQQKTIDAVDTTLTAMVDAKLYEPAKYLAVTNQNYFGQVLLMNLAKFNALPGDLKKIVEDAAKAGAAESRKAGQKADDTAVETMKKHGVTVTQAPREAFRAAVKGVHDEFAARIGTDIVDKARAMLGAR